MTRLKRLRGRLKFIAFSRNERTHPILFAGARSRDFLDCNLAAPIGFFSGAFGLVFVSSGSKNEARSSEFGQGM